MIKKILLLLIMCVIVGTPTLAQKSTEEVVENKANRVYIFTATWCSYCKYMKAFLEDPKIVEELKKYDAVVYIDIDKYPQVREDWKVKTIPDFFIVQSINEKELKTLYRWQPPRNWNRNEAKTKKYLLETFQKFSVVSKKRLDSQP